MYSINKSNHLAKIDFPKNYLGTYLPDDNVYTFLQLESEAFCLFPSVRDCASNVELEIKDDKGRRIIDCDLALNMQYDDETLRHFYRVIYQREGAGQITELVYRVNTGRENCFRIAAVAVPIWVGDIVKGHMTWNLRSLHAEPEEIALFCRLVNKYSLALF